MSVDSRSRSRSPMSNDDRRRHDKRKYERNNRAPSKRGTSDCRVYVSNIPYEFKWQDLKDLFRSEVGAVAYVEMFNDNNGRPRGSAIVDFETPEMARTATDKMHRYELKGRKLVVKEKEEVVNSRDFMFLFSKDMERDRNRFGREADRRRPYERTTFPDPVPPPVNYGNTYGLSISFLDSLGINGPLVNKVFVANLDYKLTEDDLRELFKVAGKVTSAEIIKDQDGKSRGFGVVEYEHPVQAVQAISMLHNQTYYDRKINVRLDRVAEKQQKEGPTSKLPPGLRGLGMGLGLNGEPITDVSNIASSPLLNTSSMGNVTNINPAMGLGGFDMGSANSMTSNVRPNMNPGMSMMGMSVMDPINNNMGGNTMGMGMGMSSGMGATGGLGSPNMMGGLTGMNPNSMGTVPGANSFSSQGGGGGGGGGGGMGGATSGNSLYGNNFANTTPSSDYNSNFGSMRNVVQISNLPVDYTWQNLKDLCRNYGDIRFAEIRSKGIGWVRFSTDSEARRTADMLDRQRFDGRVLDARVM